MRAYRLNGGGIDGIGLREEAMPSAAAGQVLVRIHAAALNFRDLLLAKKLDTGVIPLSDGAGEVVEVGPGVDRFRPGDRVMGLFYQSWIYGTMAAEDLAEALGGAIDGMLAEYRVMDAQGLVRVPESLDWREAATLPCAALTAWHAVRGVRGGETVLLLGTGGVSLFAMQFARVLGAQIIAISSSDAKLARLAEFGSVQTVNYRTQENWEQAVVELTGGRGVDHVVEVGGGGTLERSIAATRQGGSIHLIGVLTGGTINPVTIMLKNIKLLGIEVGSREMFEEMNRVIDAHRIRPVINRIFGFDAAPEAYRYLSAGEHMGKVVIDLAQPDEAR